MLIVNDSRTGGLQIQPFSLQKQAAVRTGVANAIGVQASDVSLDILSVFGSQVSPAFCPRFALKMLNLCPLVMSPPALSPSSCASHLPVYRGIVQWLLMVYLGESCGRCMQNAAGRKLLQPPVQQQQQPGLPGAGQLPRPGQPGQPGPQVLPHMHYSKHAPKQPSICSSRQVDAARLADAACRPPSTELIRNFCHAEE